MRSDYTPAVERAVLLARQFAEQTGSPPTVAHLFLALIDEEESRAAGLLLRAGVPIATARSCIRDTIGIGSESITIPAILGHARDLALELSGERTPGSEHV